MDDEDSEHGEEEIVTQTVETNESVLWPDHAIFVAVEEGEVLLKDCLMLVFACPVIFLGAIGCFSRGSFVCTGGS